MMQEECQGRENDLLPFPIPVDLICRTLPSLIVRSWDSPLDCFLRINCITNFGLFGKGSHVMFILYHFVCIMSVSLLDHRLQHVSPRRTKRTICLLSASMDYPAQDHPAWGRCFSIPLLPAAAAAAEPGRRRLVNYSFLHIGAELLYILELSSLPSNSGI